jgi:hypothetical protein
MLCTLNTPTAKPFFLGITENKSFGLYKGTINFSLQYLNVI